MSGLSLKGLTARYALRFVVAFLLLAVFLIGCQGGQTEETPPDVQEEPTEAPAEEAEPTEEEAEPTEEEAEPTAEGEPAEEVEPTAEGEPAEEEPAAAVSGSLSILGFGLPDEIATVRVERFEEKYPDVELNITEGSLDVQQFLTAVASGNPPDLIYTNREVLSTYATRGALMPLDDCIAQMGIDMSQYRQTAVEQVTVDGSVYGIPEFYNVILVLINDVALEEAGLTPDDLDLSDWDKIAEINQQLTKIDGDTLTRIGFDPKLPEFFPLWVHANGGQLISDDGRTAMLNSPEAIEALEFSASLHEPAGGRQNFLAFRDTWDFFGANNQFAADQLGAFPMEQWFINVLIEASPDISLSAKPFTDREGTPITYATGSAWAIPQGSKNPEAACAFAQTMTEADSWVAAAQARLEMKEAEGLPFYGVYSANSAADEVIFGELMQPSGNEGFDEAIQTAVSVMDQAFAPAPSPAGAEVRQAWIDAVNRVLNGEATAEESLNQAQEEAQEALDEGWGQ